MTAEFPNLLRWRKSSYSAANGCVEAAPMPEGLIAVRNSKRPDEGTVIYDRHEWRCFLAGVRNGEFDDLAQTPPGGISLPGVSETESDQQHA